MIGDAAVALIDLAKLRVRFDDDEELLDEIFRVFIAEIPERRASVQAALAGGDMDRLSRLAHSLKGVAGTMYAEELRQAAYAMEMAAKAGEAETVASLGAALLDVLGRTGEELRTYL